ncbi:hypothetical protein AVEN_71907-1 [Araneus ventricosus]|uniref:CCHC-type domain-containing protein n=1 Tax=Araneus ventricosus TaxID=182803 RepID=A0A4Y2MRI6_ARAVE|nr:hypothetical protein AVEN_69644-1 [Araneus ventricosus]GBN29622.1 hypothetical protein AVEN_140196-1 [Araneus ventricosus]GBN29647.1 hypothetical protein AVEN_71907-1 [Araneus ventricosus]
MAESKEITHAFVSLSDLSLDSSIFQESLKGSIRQPVLSDDETIYLDETQRSAVAGESGDEGAGEGEGEGKGDEGANGDEKSEGDKATVKSNGPENKGSERPKESDVTDPGLSALLERATALLTELGLDDNKGGQVLGLIFEAFGLRSGSMSHKARTASKPDAQKSTKPTRGKRAKTAVAPPKVTKPAPKGKADAPKVKPVDQAAEQSKSAPQSFAAAARMGASVAQNPPVRGSATSTKKAPPGRTPLAKAKRSGVTLVYPKEDSGLSTSSQVLRFLERNISLGALGVKMIASRPIRDAGVVLVTETKPMTETLRQAIESCPAVADKVSVRTPKGRVPHIIVYNVPVGKYATRDKEERWIRRLRKGDTLQEGDISVRFRRKAKNGTEDWILALAPEVFKGVPKQGRLNYGFSSLRYREFLEPTRCFKCQRFGHMKSQCPDIAGPEYCTKCTGRHAPKDCKVKRPTCRNCAEYNSKTGARTPTRHTTRNRVASGWRFLQANLGRSRPATGEIPTFRTGPHDIYLLQEPYTVYGSLAGTKLGWRAIHAQGGKAAILVSNQALDVIELVKTVNIVGVQISDRTLSVAVFSIYFPPSSNKTELVAQLSATLTGLRSSSVLIGGDINMRHQLWGPRVSDHRSSDEGLPFVDFVIKHGLNIWNDPNSDPTFHTTRVQTWIDVTVASAALDFAAHTWQVTTRTLSDHNYLEYNLGEQDVTERVPRYNLNRFRLNNPRSEGFVGPASLGRGETLWYDFCRPAPATA